ncbi:hypothetical protein IAU60_004129 [Kwoniella sp. DSM 27419]
MPIKRELTPASEDDVKPKKMSKQSLVKPAGSPAKASIIATNNAHRPITSNLANAQGHRLIAKNSWSHSEETKFREAINVIVKKHLWNELKGDEEVNKRGANGVGEHWKALYKKMQV